MLIVLAASMPSVFATHDRPQSVRVPTCAVSVRAEGCPLTVNSRSTQVSDRLPVVSPRDLAQANGKEGHRAYIAVDGLVYDVTEIPSWENGEHNGLEAGRDLSEAIGRSPHGRGVLEKARLVGRFERASKQ